MKLVINMMKIKGFKLYTLLSVVASLSETLLWLNVKSSDPSPPKKIPPGAPPGDKQ